MVSIDRDACIGCGVCTTICPDVFELDDEGKAIIKEGADTRLDCVKEAAENCPTNAIQL